MRSLLPFYEDYLVRSDLEVGCGTLVHCITKLGLGMMVSVSGLNTTTGSADKDWPPGTMGGYTRIWGFKMYCRCNCGRHMLSYPEAHQHAEVDGGQNME
jgi:hypothetical protein